MEELNEKIKGLVKKAEKSGMPYGILKKVYDRGMAAWRTGHRPGTTPQQWAFARVNSFVTKSSGTWGGADKDLAKQVRGEDVEVPKTKSVKELKACKIDVRVEKNGILHSSIGKTSFSEDDLKENFNIFHNAVMSAKPNSFKGTFLNNFISLLPFQSFFN